MTNDRITLDVEALCTAGVSERNDERTNHRNGYRDRALISSPSVNFTP